MVRPREFLAHPATRTGVATFVGYGLILALLTVALFLVPYALFRLF